jgi:hypothetical protein
VIEQIFALMAHPFKAAIGVWQIWRAAQPTRVKLFIAAAGKMSLSASHA